MQYITRVNDDYCAEALGWPKEMLGMKHIGIETLT